MIRLTAYAKVNFFLEITGRRADGYHTLSTLFQTISIGDRLTLSRAEDLSMTCSDSSLPTDERNLVMRAALALRAHLGKTPGARIHLDKKVPMGAGLGGGSSDAAVVLRTLPKLWKRTVSESALKRLALKLGADVPFFLEGGLCHATGIGEKLKALKPLPKTWIVLIYPGFGVSTKEAYSKVRLPFASPFEKGGLRGILSSKKSPRAPLFQRGGKSILFNRFEELVFPDHPALPALKQRLMDLGASGALMSGSGSSVFAVVPSRAVGDKILKALRSQYPQSWLVHTL